MYSIGLMSGTSMDGIDVALIETDGTPHHLRPIGHTSISYSPACRLLLKAAEFSVRRYEGDCERANTHFEACLDDFFEQALALNSQERKSHYNTLVQVLNGSMSLHSIIDLSTQLHIQAVQQLLAELAMPASAIDIIGYHGQCFYHQPARQISVIVGNGQAMADALQIRVVNDFRRSDIHHGGQGAPFAPLYHQALAIRDQVLPVAVVNCGGISNITFVMGDNERDLIAFDTGPGNALLDQLMRQRTQGQLHYDSDGYYALQGKVDESVLASLFASAVQKGGENYFNITPPKSLDYGDLLLIPVLEALNLPDACKTLAAFTAQSIVNSLDWIAQAPPSNWVLAGGGWKNPVIVSEFKARLTERYHHLGVSMAQDDRALTTAQDNRSLAPTQVKPELTIKMANEVGWQNDALEAQIFAYFAVRRLHDLPLSFPQTTGVRMPVTGGEIYHFLNSSAFQP